jgi:hypothetical protein
MAGSTAAQALTSMCQPRSLIRRDSGSIIAVVVGPDGAKLN